MVAMVVTMAGKVEHDQRVAGRLGRTDENRTRRPNTTELQVVRGLADSSQSGVQHF